MDRDIPVFNRPIIQKIQKQNQQRHLTRLRDIKTGNTTRSSLSNHRHTISGKKHSYQQEVKRTEIQKQNAMLFSKMIRIMNRNDPYNQPTRAKGNSKSIIDNSRIAQENRQLFQRLEQQRPTISNRKLQSDRIKNLNILRFIGRYPTPNASRITGQSYPYSYSHNMQESSTQNNTNAKSKSKDPHLQEFAIDQTAFDHQIRAYQEQVKKIRERPVQSSEGRRRYMSQSGNRQTVREQKNQKIKDLQIQILDPLNKQNINIVTTKNQQYLQRQQNESNKYIVNPNKTKQITLFCKKDGIVDQKICQIQVLRTPNLYKLRVTFQQMFQGKTVYEQLIPDQEGTEFFSHYNYNYLLICKMMTIQQGNLVINPQIRQISNKKESETVLNLQRSTKTKSKAQINTFEAEDPKWAEYQQALEESID